MREGGDRGGGVREGGDRGGGVMEAAAEWAVKHVLKTLGEDLQPITGGCFLVFIPNPSSCTHRR